ncbi:MAG: hypothetical protein IT204_23345 [Fimbriimonadaceae bacterium]|nr:hypothetical protein [Fimbriimonadaceae bacterium]
MSATQPESPDPRHLSHGLEIPTQSYSDQPYLVQTADGAWLCCVTTGPGHEGAQGQHVATLRSTDQGRTWSQPVPVEPGDRRENSYAVMLAAPSGRVFVFYNHNTDDVREVRCHDGERTFSRVDSLGHFVFKCSDDGGRSWSAERYDIPQRLFEIDRANVYGGELRFFWNVGKPFVLDGCAYVSLHKVGEMGRGFFQRSEGVLLRSDNLLTEPDPAQIRWETLPDGEVGLRTPPGGGKIAEEQSYSVLTDGSIYCVYRSIDGYPVESYSRDGGRSWALPRYKRYADGRLIKNPRAANFAWSCGGGRYLYWFHNHGGRVMREAPRNADWGAYDDRNPVWLSAGLEVDTPAGREIAWSEPEIALYDSDPFVRISYPDQWQEAGRTYLSETQKDLARVHEVPADLLEGMWSALALQLGQASDGPPAVPTAGLLLALPGDGAALPATVALPTLPAFRVRDTQALDFRGKDTGAGLAWELLLTLPDLAPGRLLLDNRAADGRGCCLRTAAAGALEVLLSDGQSAAVWSSDAVLQAGQTHHVVVNLDGGPRVISYVIDGRFGDGGDARQFGWGRFSPHLRHLNGGELRIDAAVGGLWVWGRVLRTCEALVRAAQRPARQG